MVYSSRFVVSVIVDRKIQKELANEIVPIKFGSIYALRFRNKNNRRAVVKFTIDGENVSGSGYVIPANDFIDIKRHWHKDATFKFVDLESPEAVDFGKNGLNDGTKGVIEAKFYLEKEITHQFYEPCYPWPMNPYNFPKPKEFEQQIWCSTSTNYLNFSDTPVTCDASTTPNKSTDQNQPVYGHAGEWVHYKDGCTVEGNQSGQNFSSTYIDLETDFVLLRCILKGLSDLPAQTSYCTSCGAKKPRQADNFCGVCGKKF